MTRLIMRFNDDSTINIQANYIDVRDDWVMAWNGENMVAVAKSNDVKSCYLSEQKS